MAFAAIRIERWGKKGLGIMRRIGWITEGNAFAKKPLLGMPCDAYVRKALAEWGAEPVESGALPGEVETALIARGDVPAMTGAALEALARGARERPCVLVGPDSRTPLALALNAEALALAVDGGPSLPTVGEAVERLNSRGVAPRVCRDGQADACLPVTDAKSYAEAFGMLNRVNIGRQQDNGVLILDPERTVIEGDVTIGEGTVVYAGNTLQGATSIGRDCVLYPNNRMQNAIVGDGTTVESSVLLDCQIGSGATVGPYAYLRPQSRIGDRCRIGDFVEVKNSSIGDGTKVSHLTYVGDSDLGREINLGCGVVFVNYDGKTKNRSQVEDHAFIGCNCNLVAPVHIGKNAYLAAGSTVAEDVPEDALFIARSRGVVKEGWVKRRKEAGKL